MRVILTVVSDGSYRYVANLACSRDTYVVHR